jgi:predicted  nucleic acid-binding Zn-ribbon protein
MSDETQAFAVAFAGFLRTAEKLAQMDGIDEAFAEAEKRLANKNLELQAAMEKVSAARDEAEKIASGALDEKTKVLAAAQAKCDEMIAAAAMTARQHIADATGDAEQRKAGLTHEIGGLEKRLASIKDELSAHIGRRDAAAEEARAAMESLDGAKAALAELKAKF